MRAGNIVMKISQGLAATLALVLILAWMAGVFHDKTEPGKVDSPAVTADENAATATVKRVETDVYETAIGTLLASRRTAVSSKILASIDEVRVSAGDTVKKGEVVIVLDGRDLKARLSQAQEGVRGAQAVMDQMTNEHMRKRKLFENETIGQSEYDQAVAAYAVAEADLKKAKQAVEEATVAMGETEITAPVAGRVVDRLAEPGDMANPGRPLLNIYDPSALRLEAPIRESLIGMLGVGSKVEVEIDATGAVLACSVEEIVPQAEAGARSFLVKFALPTSEGLFSGMSGQARIPTGKRARVLAPADAIESVGQLDYVKIVVGEERRIERRLVTTGWKSSDGKVEILSGLREGEEALVR